MSGLLVKSTVIMKENLQEMAARGVADRWPVLLGGAALTRAFVEDDLRSMFAGQVHYARDAFEGLSLMDRMMAAKRGGAPVVDPEREAALAARRARRERQRAVVTEAMPSLDDSSVRSDVAADVEVPVPPFFGTRVVKRLPLADYAALLDERATFLGQWGLRGTRGGAGLSYEELVDPRGAAPAAVLAEPAYRRQGPRSRRRLRLLSGLLGRQRPGGARREWALRAGRVHFSPAAAGTAVVPGRLLPSGRRGPGRRRPAVGHRRPADQRVHRQAVRRQRVPRLPGGARPVGAAHRGPGGVLASADPGGRAVADDDPADLVGLLRIDYRGCRYAFGYPACPDLEDRAKIVDLLGAERIGVQLSEEFQLVPEQATDATVVHHPDANYFNAK